MVMLDSTRMVIPTESQAAVLKDFLLPNFGMQKTYATAAQLNYWPGMKTPSRSLFQPAQLS